MWKYLEWKSFDSLVNHASGYIQDENKNKYFIFYDFVNENKALLKKYADVWDGIKNKVKAINGGEENNYKKDYIKIKFNSVDDLSLNKPLKFPAVTIIIRSVFEEVGKIFPQVFLDDTLKTLMKIKNRPDYLFNDNMIVNFQDFDSSLIEIKNLSFNGVFSLNIYYIKYIFIKSPNRVNIDRTDNGEDFLCFFLDDVDDILKKIMELNIKILLLMKKYRSIKKF